MKFEDIPYQEKFIPDCYHGTDSESASKINRDACFVPSTGDDQYLGDGTYFFEGDLERAEDWGRNKARKRRKPKFSVFKATINLGKCLDLAVRKHIDVLYHLQQKLRARGSYKITDAIVINYLAAHIIPIDCVKCAYTSKRTLYEDSRIPSESRVVICVRNSKQIVSFVEFQNEEVRS